jgi:hypothetical protein
MNQLSGGRFCILAEHPKLAGQSPGHEFLRHLSITVSGIFLLWGAGARSKKSANISVIGSSPDCLDHAFLLPSWMLM